MAVKSCRGRRKSRSCRAYRERTLQYLERAVQSWQAIFERSVEIPSWDAESCSELAGLVKKFLGREVSDLPEEQLAFQSIKKGLPDSCRCMSAVLLDKLVSSIGGEARALPSGYLDFVRKEVSSLFPKAWDASYESYCLTTTPPLSAVDVPESACASSGSRSTGGCLGWKPWSQSDFLKCVLHGEGEFDYATGRLLVVQSAGKPRPLSKFHAGCLALRPLHKTIYGFLKRKKWLLVGPPSEDALRRAGFKEGGGVLVSGDYASATDGLSIEVAEAILETLLVSSTFVPLNVKAGAMDLLRPVLRYEVDGGFEVVEASVGQMMGSYLSFPLLCLQNYLAFRWSLRGTSDFKKHVPVLINGDDILYQKDDHFNRWQRTISSVGLTVEESKTSVKKDWGTLNSTLLRWKNGSLTPCWSARFGMFRPAEHPTSLGRTFLEFLRGCDEPQLRFRAGREFFRWHLAELRSAGVSPVSLGFRGLLARRLSGIYSLLELPLSEMPPAYRKHDVGYDADFVSRIDIGSFGQEELFQSSLELGAEKWSKGWREVLIEREAVRYCLARTAAKGDRFDYPAVPTWVFGGEAHFSFSLRNAPKYRRRKVAQKAFLAEFPPRLDILVSWNVLEQLAGILPESPPPPYEEEIAGAA